MSETDELKLSLHQILSEVFHENTKKGVADRLNLTPKVYRSVLGEIYKGASQQRPRFKTLAHVNGKLLELDDLSRTRALAALQRHLRSQGWQSLNFTVRYQPAAAARVLAKESTPASELPQVITAFSEFATHFFEQVLSETGEHASREPLKDRLAWQYAQRVIGTYDKRHLYVELLSVITPKTWESQNWRNHQQHLFQLLWESPLDAARRLHILDFRRLPQRVATLINEELATECDSVDVVDEVREDHFRVLQGLTLAEYLSGIRSRSVFLCPSLLDETAPWPYWQQAKAFLFDAGCFYQSNPPEVAAPTGKLNSEPLGHPDGYRVIFTDLEPFVEAQKELRIYTFEPENVEQIYWMLKANCYRLLRCKSKQVRTIFDLLGTELPVEEEFWSVVWRFLPPLLKQLLAKEASWQAQVAGLYLECQKPGLEKKREFTFEHCLKSWLKELETRHSELSPTGL